MNPYVRLLIQSMITGGATAALATSIVPAIWGDYSKLGEVFLGGAVLGLLNHLAHNPFVAAAEKSDFVSIGNLKDK